MPLDPEGLIAERPTEHDIDPSNRRCRYCGRTELEIFQNRIETCEKKPRERTPLDLLFEKIDRGGRLDRQQLDRARSHAEFLEEERIRLHNVAEGLRGEITMLRFERTEIAAELKKIYEAMMEESKHDC